MGISKNARQVLGGTAIAQCIAIGGTPLITRLYDPIDIGKAAAFLAVFWVTSSVGCLRYEQAVVLGAGTCQRASVAILALAIGLLLSASLTASAVLLAAASGDALGEWASQWAFPLGVINFAACLSALGGNCALVSGMFSVIGRARIAKAVCTLGMSLGFAYGGSPDGGSLIWAQCAGLLLEGIVLLPAVKDVVWRHRDGISLLKIRSALLRNRDFPCYSAPAALVRAVAWEVPALMLFVSSGAGVLGMYSLGVRVVQLPHSIVGAALGQAILPELAVVDSQRRAAIVRRTIGMSATVGAFSTGVLAVGGPTLFALVFGEPWRESGLYAQLLAPWFFLWFLSIPLHSVFVACNGQRTELAWHIVIICQRSMAMALGLWMSGPLGAVALLGVTGIAGHGGVMIAAARLGGLNGWTALRCLAQPVPVALLCSLPFFGVSWLPTGWQLPAAALLLIAAASAYFRAEVVRSLLRGTGARGLV